MMPDYFYVVFSGESRLWWLRGLKRGFKHCYVLVRLGEIWVCIDPLSHKTEVMRIDETAEMNLLHWLRDNGETLVFVQPPAQRQAEFARALWPALFSCVEDVKRIIGVRAPSIVTPYQLYTYLVQEKSLCKS